MGELYTKYDKSEKKLNGYYSFRPVSMLPVFGYDIFDMEFNVLSDLSNFLSFNNFRLNTAAIDNITGSLLKDPEKISGDCIKSATESLISLSVYFKHDTEFHLYDLIMQYIISIVSPFDADEPSLLDHIVEWFNGIQCCLIKKIFIRSTYDEQALIHYYNGILYDQISKQNNTRYNLPGPCDEFWAIQDFIINNIPPSGFKINSQWQKFIDELNSKFGAVYRLAPYSFTNHVCCQFMKAKKWKITTDDDETLLKDSAVQARHTSPIFSFYGFIIAELYALFDNKIVLNPRKIWDKKALYSYYPHADHNNLEKIFKKHNQKVQRIKAYYKNNHDGYNSKKPNNDLYHNKYEELLKYHKIILHKALSTQMPYEEYEDFIEQPHLSHLNIDKVLEYMEEEQATLNDLGESITLNAICRVKIRFPDFGEIIDPKEEEKEIEAYKNMHFSDIDLEEILSKMEKKEYEDQPVPSNDHIDSDTGNNAGLSENKNIYDHTETYNTSNGSDLNGDITQ